MRQTGVNQNVVNRARQGEIVNDPQFDCFAACLLGQIGLVSLFFFFFYFILSKYFIRLLKIIIIYLTNQTNNDGSLNANVAAAKVPFNYPNRDSIVNAIYYCSNQSKFYFIFYFIKIQFFFFNSLIDF